MTRDDLAALLAEHAAQTPACGPARDALVSGGGFEVYDGLVPADRHCHTYRRRLRHTRKRGLATLGLAETVSILERAGDEAVRLGLIQTADRAWSYVLFIDATATTVLACARGARQASAQV
ncbi:hypothetical protein [Yinghuangia sp. YIM S09857]|uniref:hypothetical protein n=1 Tax=Yinghuangia sp. YIM S09857 TaxID=3436929 RepID=UPI003F53A377